MHLQAETHAATGVHLQAETLEVAVHALCAKFEVSPGARTKQSWGNALVRLHRQRKWQRGRHGGNCVKAHPEALIEGGTEAKKREKTGDFFKKICVNGVTFASVLHGNVLVRSGIQIHTKIKKTRKPRGIFIVHHLAW